MATVNEFSNENSEILEFIWCYFILYRKVLFHKGGVGKLMISSVFTEALQQVIAVILRLLYLVICLVPSHAKEILY